MKGHIPVLFVRAHTLPEAWEKAILVLWERGVDLRTEYDRPEDPPSKDATVLIEVTDPLAEPRIHRNIPCGLEELEIYRQEVLYGIHDHWIDPSDPDKWTYTYHQRLFSYRAVEELEDPSSLGLSPVDQIQYILDKLCERPYTRRAQATTWIPSADPKTEHPPCLQRIWFRILEDEEGNLLLNMNTHWRSRDAYKAWFMNAYALTEFQKEIAESLSSRLARNCRPARYVDISDSLHIYGSYFPEVEPEIEKMKRLPDYTRRAWSSTDAVVARITEETRQKLAHDPDYLRRSSPL